MPETHLWEAYLMFEDHYWETAFFRAPTEKAIEEVLTRTAEYRRVVNFKIQNADHEDLPENVNVKDLG
jgi:hypothetical protein